ncbi:type II toxin-antitoxin system ParD family antitoxin [Maricaulis sp.]|uniref:type II toxin-antitoxin system ParD family antitoxin n=1 Tax=Maricaulis sp. TaxID=1486257 RepID=UPI003A90776D
MNVSIGKRWELFVEEQVKQGRYTSQSEVVREGLRLVEEREAKLAELRASLQAAINDERRYTIHEAEAHLAATFEQLKSGAQ